MNTNKILNEFKENSDLSSLPEEFKCAHCKTTMIEPHLLSCGHIICNFCLDKLSIKKPKICLLDNEIINASLQNKPLQKKIEMTEIRCLISHQCNWRGKLVEFLNHYEKCIYNLVDCGFNCGKKFKMDLLEFHEKNQCLKRKIMCNFCFNEINYDDFKTHLDDVCEKVMINCPNKCKKNGEIFMEIRKNINDHLKNCELRTTYCSLCREDIKQNFLNEHYKEANFSHFSALNELILDLKKRNDLQEENFNVLKRKREVGYQQIKTLKEKINNLEEENRLLKINQEKIAKNIKMDKKLLKPKNDLINNFSKKNSDDNIQGVKKILDSDFKAQRDHYEYDSFLINSKENSELDDENYSAIESKISEDNEEAEHSSSYKIVPRGKMNKNLRKKILFDEEDEEINSGPNKKNDKFSSDTQSEIKFENGDVYIGEIRNGLREGKGLCKFSNNSTYDGDWRNDNENGKGILKYYNGSVYEGDFKNGEFSGQGKFTYFNGAIYNGEWKNDKKNGKGTYTTQEEEYEGNWKDNKRSGFGTFNSPYEIYVGEWKNGKKHGNGKKTIFSDGVYDGEWRNNYFTGKGKHISNIGDIYQGEFKDGKYHGFGEMDYTNRESYIGQWKYNEKFGKGIFKFLDGTVYEGFWKWNMKNGDGILKENNGNVIYGKWINDLLCK